MTLTDIATIASILSSFAIVASLLYLGLQTHQNVKHTRALIQQGRAARTVAHNMAMADADLVAARIAADGGTPTSEGIQRSQTRYVNNALFAGFQDSFDQHRVGLLGEDQFDSFRAGVVAAMSRSSVREYWKDWKAHRPHSNVKFKAFMDECMAKGLTTIPPAQ